MYAIHKSYSQDITAGLIGFTFNDDRFAYTAQKRIHILGIAFGLYGNYVTSGAYVSDLVFSWILVNVSQVNPYIQNANDTIKGVFAASTSPGYQDVAGSVEGGYSFKLTGNLALSSVKGVDVETILCVTYYYDIS